MAKKKAKGRPQRKANPKKQHAAAKNKSAGGKSKRPARSTAKTASSWLDAASEQPVIERYARRLESFVAAMADGKVDAAEVQAQETRLVKLMKDVEPQLSPAMHEKVTRLLCELTAYDLMRILHAMEEARPKTTFQG